MLSHQMNHEKGLVFKAILDDIPNRRDHFFVKINFLNTNTFCPHPD